MRLKQLRKYLPDRRRSKDSSSLKKHLAPHVIDSRGSVGYGRPLQSALDVVSMLSNITKLCFQLENDSNTPFRRSAGSSALRKHLAPRVIDSQGFIG